MKNKTLIPIILVLVIAAISVWYFGGFNSGVEISPGVKNPDTAGFRVVTHTEFENPVTAYDFQLTDQDNQPFSLSDLQGKVVMISFIYTHCPEACPLVAANFKSTSEMLKSEGYEGEFAQVLVTTDPENDSVERLNRYTTALGGDWYFLTGEMDDLQKVWDKYDIYWEVKERTKEIVVYHSYKTFIIDQTGKVRYEFVGVWFPNDIIPSIEELILN